MTMSWIIMIIMAIIIGVIGSAIAPGRMPGGILGSMIAGFVGAWIGGMLLGSWGPQLGGFSVVPAIIGAALFVLILSLLSRGMNRAA